MNHGDIADRANDLVEREQKARQDAIQAQAAIKPVATGRCFYCDDIVVDEARFCGPDCRDGWEYENEAKKRNGKR